MNISRTTNQTSFKARSSINTPIEMMLPKQNIELKELIKKIGAEKDYVQIDISPLELVHKNNDILECYSMEVLTIFRTIKSKINISVSRSIMTADGISTQLMPFRKLKTLLTKKYLEKEFT